MSQGPTGNYKPAGMRGFYADNLIINGNFDIWQRGTSFPGLSVVTYTADRWQYQSSNSGAVHTISRSTDVPTFAESGAQATYSLLLDCTTADATVESNNRVSIRHSIEGYNFAKVAQKDFTLSFWVKATKTGIYTIAFRNSGADRSYVVEYTINSSATWEKKVITVPASPSAGTWDYTNGIGIRIDFVIMAGTDFHTTPNAWQSANVQSTSNQVNGSDSTANDFRLALVQLEEGVIASPFEVRSEADESDRCKRYYEKSYNSGQAPATITVDGAACQRSPGTSVHIMCLFSVEMRGTPTIVFYSSATGATGKARNITSGADCNATAAGQSAGRTIAICDTTVADNNHIKVHYTADAELL